MEPEVTGGRWMIAGSLTGAGGVRTVPLHRQWPHQVPAWQFFSEGWQTDPLLTVTGN